jgi:non-ribosomal peptide synthetase component F
MNQHDALLNRLLWARDEYAIGAGDRVMQKTPFGFDVSVWEFFLPLLAGARLVLARPGGHQDPEYLARLIEDAGVTTMHFVPSMLQVFLDPLEPRAPAIAAPGAVQRRGAALRAAGALRAVPAARRAAQPLWPDRGRHRRQRVALRRRPASRHRADRPPIANMRLYVLDRHLQPVPAGCPGEIHIGGIGVARGYLNRPELTAERFVPDPFAPTPAAPVQDRRPRRWLPDGAIEYLGRNDFQVKIRGMRIELGEIESALRACADVLDAVVSRARTRPATSASSPTCAAARAATRRPPTCARRSRRRCPSTWCRRRSSRSPSSR